MQALLSSAGALRSLQHARVLQRAFASEASSTVCFMDPKYLLDNSTQSSGQKENGERTTITATVPKRLLEQLPHAKFVKGDTDAPESHWVVGESTEMFNYKLLGVHKVTSGFTCIVDAPDAKPGQVRDFMPKLSGSLDWDKFVQLAKDEHTSTQGEFEQQNKWWPEQFLWSGRLVDCASAAVYMRKDGKGLWIHSNYDPLDW